MNRNMKLSIFITTIITLLLAPVLLAQTATPALMPTPPPPSTTPTPSASPTPSDCDTLGVTLWMPDTTLEPGDTFECAVYVCNPSTEPVTGISVFAILDIYGYYYFYPSFGLFDYVIMDFPPGWTKVPIIPPFIWPEGMGSGSAMWYAAMVNDQLTEIIGNLDMLEFWWIEP